jgi:hypothetical protein
VWKRLWKAEARGVEAAAKVKGAGKMARDEWLVAAKRWGKVKSVEHFTEDTEKGWRAQRKSRKTLRHAAGMSQCEFALWREFSSRNIT